MDMPLMMRRKGVLPALVGTVAAVAIMIALFNPVSLWGDLFNAARVRWELPRAMGRWRSRGGATYRLHVKGGVPLACFIDGELSVQHGQFVDVRMRQNPLIPKSPMLSVDRSGWSRQGCAYEDLTVERMFQRVQEDLARSGLFGASLRVRFDRETGYVTEYRNGRPSGGGLLEPTASECCTWFSFDGLTLSPPP